MYQVFTMILTTIAAVLLVFLIYKYMYNKKPPGPIRWPIIGNIVELWLEYRIQKYPHLVVAEFSKKYGEIMSFAFGVHDAVLISSFEVMTDIMSKEELLGRYSFPFAIDRAFGLPWQGGLVWSDIWVWKGLRKHSMKTLKHFGYGKVQMDQIIRTQMNLFISDTQEAINQNNGIFEIDALKLVAFASSVIFKLAADITFSYDDKAYLKMLKHSTTEIKILNFTNIYNLFPALRHWFPKLTNHDEHMLIYKELQDFMKEVVEKVKINRAARGTGQEPKNYVEAFIDEIEEHNMDDARTVFTDEQLLLMLMDLLGGAEVMSPVLQWSFLFLALNPEVQEKVRNEIYEVQDEIEDETIPISDLISRMPYTKATMIEIYRMSNLTPLPPPRKTLKSYSYKGFVFPKDSLIIWNLHPIMTDQAHWGDPDVFRPERFLDESGTKIVNSERVVTFGFGKRTCFGQSLAWNIMFTGIVYFLKTFNLEVIPGKEPSAKNPYKALALAPRRYCLKATSKLK